MKRFNTEIEFLNDYWKEAKNIGFKIKEELPKCTENNKSLKFITNKSGIKMFIVNYSDLGNSWSVEDILRNVAGKSKNLEALADKINYMINKGRANDVKPMLEKICIDRIKSFSHIPGKKSTLNKEFLGKGHFKWNFGVYKLNQLEIRHIKTYFKLK